MHRPDKFRHRQTADTGRHGRQVPTRYGGSRDRQRCVRTHGPRGLRRQCRSVRRTGNSGRPDRRHVDPLGSRDRPPCAWSVASGRGNRRVEARRGFWAQPGRHASQETRQVRRAGDREFRHRRIRGPLRDGNRSAEQSTEHRDECAVDAIWLGEGTSCSQSDWDSSVWAAITSTKACPIQRRVQEVLQRSSRLGWRWDHRCRSQRIRGLAAFATAAFGVYNFVRGRFGRM